MSDDDAPRKKLRIAVLMGGTSSERPISLSTGRMIVSALDPERYLVSEIDTWDVFTLRSAEGGGPDCRAAIGAPPSPGKGLGSPAVLTPHDSSNPDAGGPDVVFIALHGKGGEDGTIQGMLELLGLPYTGSGVLASALAMDKVMSKQVLAMHGIPVLPHVLVRRGEPIDWQQVRARVCDTLVEYPVFVKPNAEGSTFGCTLVRCEDDLVTAVAEALRYDTTVIIEQYIQGMEITVGVLEDAAACSVEPLPPIEIVPRSAFYDYDSKYATGGSEHIIPARLPAAMLRLAQELAVRSHRALGCRGMSRTDMMVAGDRMFVLELNTIPGMTPTSLLPQAAEHAGISFPALLDRLIACAMKERGL